VKQVKVIGLGNVLMGDDGFGPWAVRTLEATWDFPQEVSLEDLGTPGFDLVPHLSGADALIVLDTVNAEADPGEVHTYDRDAIATTGPRVGPHDSTLNDTLLALELEGAAPDEVLVIGVVPGQVRTGPSLSGAVRDAFLQVEQRVIEELARLGVTATRKAAPRDPDLWWEPKPCTR